MACIISIKLSIVIEVIVVIPDICNVPNGHDENCRATLMSALSTEVLSGGRGEIIPTRQKNHCDVKVIAYR